MVFNILFSDTNTRPCHMHLAQKMFQPPSSIANVLLFKGFFKIIHSPSVFIKLI